MKKLGIFLMLSASCALFSMERVAGDARLSKASTIEADLGRRLVFIHDTERALGRYADLLSIQRVAIVKNLEILREAFRDNTLGSSELGLIRFHNNVLAVVLAEDLFGDEVFAQDVIAWVGEYLENEERTKGERAMAGSLYRLIRYALIGADEFNVPLKLRNELKNAAQQLFATLFGKLARSSCAVIALTNSPLPSKATSKTQKK